MINLSLGGAARPARPDARHVLAARGGRGRRTRRARAWSSSRPSATATRRRSTPWPFASYPAALPHVIGVSALARDGSVPGFSNRDRDLQRHRRAGRGHLLDAAAALTAQHTRRASSRATPTAARPSTGTPTARRSRRRRSRAAAALLLAQHPSLDADQVACAARALRGRRERRDRLRRMPAAAATRSPAGAGSTSPRRSQRAASGALPPRDRFEPNDDAGAGRARVSAARTRDRRDARLLGRPDATSTRSSSPRASRLLRCASRAPAAARRRTLVLWRPGTRTRRSGALAARDRGRGSSPRTPARTRAPRLPRDADAAGWYYVQVQARLAAGAGRYTLVRQREQRGRAATGSRAARRPARRAARAPGCRRRASAAGRPSSRPRRRRRTPPRRSRCPGRGSRRRRRARRGGSSGP